MTGEKIKTQVLIVGQGISGTMLSWFLYTSGVDFLVIENNKKNTSSRTSAGIINPVTGRRVVTVWMDDVIIPFAEKTYQQMEHHLNIKAITKTSIVDFFPNPFMKESFQKKIDQDAPYISWENDEENYSAHFNYNFGIGKIEPTYIVHLQNILSSWQEYLIRKGTFFCDSFSFSKLEVSQEKIFYENIEADQIIFCDGMDGNTNPYFSLLPFALNKGEVLLVEVPEISHHKVYKKNVALVPFGKEGLFWAGSNYVWDFDDDRPTDAFRKSTEQALNSWLKIPFKIVDHIAALRPATVERRPFVGFHPIYKNVGILNGMGTKGCSLSPFFAHQLVENIIEKKPIQPEADVARFSGVLSRTYR